VIKKNFSTKIIIFIFINILALAQGKQGKVDGCEDDEKCTFEKVEEAKSPCKEENLKCALDKLAGSTINDCSICVNELKRDAYKILNKEFPAGRLIVGTSKCTFIKTKGCQENEFVLSCFQVEGLKKNQGKEKEYPFIVFRVHSYKDHLVGIKKSDYSSPLMVKLLKASKKSKFTGQIELINYKYGDGKTYNFNESRNVLQLHCKIKTLKKIK